VSLDMWRFDTDEQSVLTPTTTDRARRTINAEEVAHDTHPRHHDHPGAARHCVGRTQEAPRGL